MVSSFGCLNTGIHRAGSQRKPSGFTLVEALVAVSITAIAGTALLTSIGSTVSAGHETMLQSIAAGLAEQMLDEINSVRFPDGNLTLFLPSTRETYDDIDDYRHWSSQPPRHRNGEIIGQETRLVYNRYKVSRVYPMRPNPEFLNNFSRSVEVQRVEPDGSNGWNVVYDHTHHRRVIVTVCYTDAKGQTRTLAEVSRIFSAIPPLP